ncbi:MAG: hypothetical protein E5W72_24950, partial [Mesorhizobium sp.]
MSSRRSRFGQAAAHPVQGNRFSFRSLVPSVCAAPHLPGGILSPHRDRERGALIDGFANHQH